MSRSLTVRAFRLLASRLWTGLMVYASVSIAESYSDLDLSAFPSIYRIPGGGLRTHHVAIEADI